MTQSEAASLFKARTVRPLESSRPPRRVGEWELLGLAASGAFAEVYRARSANSQESQPAPYAVKLLKPQWCDRPEGAALLLREAVIGRSICHPHLISILAAGVKQPPLFVVMPWLEGATLADRLASAESFELPVALWIVRQAAEALDALYAAGWMHGDVKPSNLFVSPEGHVTLLDLGFARRLEEESGSAVNRCLMGTCAYLAPEMVTSALRADIRSDLYSLGVVLFELLAGRRPFGAATLAELVTQQRQAAPPDLRRLAPHLPTAVVRLARELIAKEPLRRPQTPRELVERLMALEIATFGQRSRQ